MTRGVRIALWVGGGVAAVGVVIVGYKVLTGPRTQAPAGGGVRPSAVGALGDLFHLGASAASEYRSATTGDRGPTGPRQGLDDASVYAPSGDRAQIPA